jgi:glycerate-2-kinase
MLASNALFAQASQAIDAAAALDPSYTIKEEPISTRRPIRVVCMGAGYSGLMMTIMFSQKMKGKNAELVVYERNEDLGGTWLLNRYDQPTQRRDAHRLTWP